MFTSKSRECYLLYVSPLWLSLQGTILKPSFLNPCPSFVVTRQYKEKLFLKMLAIFGEYTNCNCVFRGIGHKKVCFALQPLIESIAFQSNLSDFLMHCTPTVIFLRPCFTYRQSLILKKLHTHFLQCVLAILAGNNISFVMYYIRYIWTEEFINYFEWFTNVFLLTQYIP